MSVLLDLSLFPTDQGSSLSHFVAPVIAMIRDSGHPYRLGPMGTVVETETMDEALDIIARAERLLDERGCERVYVTAKFDVRRGATGRLSAKIDAVREKIGDLNA